MGMLLRRHRLKKEAEAATDEVVEKSSEITKPNSRSKKDEIKAYLTSKEIEFNESANNEELLALVE